ncbi:hypothetical protein BJ166DRAFT_363467 [Pestalotiopsis sp. NC0098]|nr:hypothetical protein BJ166DRAFT_363467 [Pestalotiopsis sp. NC0098]
MSPLGLGLWLRCDRGQPVCASGEIDAPRHLTPWTSSPDHLVHSATPIVPSTRCDASPKAPPAFHAHLLNDGGIFVRNSCGVKFGCQVLNQYTSTVATTVERAGRYRLPGILNKMNEIVKNRIESCYLRIGLECLFCSPFASIMPRPCHQIL